MLPSRWAASRERTRERTRAALETSEDRAGQRRRLGGADLGAGPRVASQGRGAVGAVRGGRGGRGSGELGIFFCWGNICNI